ncbi:hypothetical protein NADFUDRAFT_47190 [Nadsonia fulvescens var. elongata DSM 6958]|uniref:DUF1531-domain-containing protein n=1 Tax=Nadsonia fulvescens var. elongata DSM 6958 TaxID=857566 RepID=A0A1E3PI27_9ASCO|nr:hypothetical protein NADFUDRAFT_47190 [Nadsonia fulvescens var. elongata DSM 6958]
MLEQLNVFNSMSLKDFIRLCAVVFGYMLLRPRLLEFAKKVQTRKQNEASEHEKEATKTAVLKEYDTLATGNDWGWGKKAQTRLASEKLIQESKFRKQAEIEEMDSDEEIEEFLDQ